MLNTTPFSQFISLPYFDLFLMPNLRANLSASLSFLPFHAGYYEEMLENYILVRSRRVTL